MVIATIYESCWSTGAAGLPLVVVIATIYESQFRTTPQPPLTLVIRTAELPLVVVMATIYESQLTRP